MRKPIYVHHHINILKKKDGIIILIEAEKAVDKI